MSFPETLELWIYYCEILANPSLHPRHQNAERCLWAIEDHWGHRNRFPDFDDYFVWPTADAPFGDGEFHVEWPSPYGVLRLMGYQVGRVNGKPEPFRRGVLHRVFKLRLPPILPVSDLNSWGTADSGPRLQKMAESIAAFCRNAKRQSGINLRQAIDEWESDLEFLRSTYYEGRFNFPYPQVHDH